MTSLRIGRIRVELRARPAIVCPQWIRVNMLNDVVDDGSAERVEVKESMTFSRTKGLFLMRSSRRVLRQSFFVPYGRISG